MEQRDWRRIGQLLHEMHEQELAEARRVALDAKKIEARQRKGVRQKMAKSPFNNHLSSPAYRKYLGPGVPVQ